MQPTLAQQLVHHVLFLVVALSLFVLPLKWLGVWPARWGVGWLLGKLLHLACWLCWTAPVGLVQAIGAAWGDTALEVRCTNGCGRPIKVKALTTCRCGYRSFRSLFAPCPLCGATRRHVRCPTCGISVPRRAIWTLGAAKRTYY